MGILDIFIEQENKEPLENDGKLADDSRYTFLKYTFHGWSSEKRKMPWLHRRPGRRPR